MYPLGFRADGQVSTGTSPIKAEEVDGSPAKIAENKTEPQADTKDGNIDIEGLPDGQSESIQQKTEKPDVAEHEQPQQLGAPTSTVNQATPTAPANTPYLGNLPIDVCFEASKLPLDVAIFNSARAAGGDEKIRKYLQAVLVIGGSALIPGMAHALESRYAFLSVPFHTSLIFWVDLYHH